MHLTVPVNEKWFEALGTMNYIKIFGNQDDSIYEQVIGRVKEIEERMSAFLPTSDISRINSQAGSGMVQIHTDTMQVLMKGFRYAILSQGAFDMTIRPLVELWGIGKKADFIPIQEEIQAVLPLVNYQNLILDEAEGLAGLRREGQKIDLGGIAKGYAADEVKRILEENHVRDALINLGGNVLTIGQSPDKEYWNIGVQNPLAPTGNYLGILKLAEKTVVTSGSNERFFIKDGVRYHHILDANTGYPARSGLLSVTVVATSSIEADALTTCLFVMGLEEGLDFLKQFDVDAVFITEDLEVYLTEGLLDCFQM